VTENVKHADIVSFTCLKAFAFDQRYELKDAHDIAYCIENSEGGIEAIAKAFQAARAGKHRKAIDEALGILAKRFTTDGAAEGYKKDGPVAVANFESDRLMDQPIGRCAPFSCSRPPGGRSISRQ
jgi:hypothetical protein